MLELKMLLTDSENIIHSDSEQNIETATKYDNKLQIQKNSTLLWYEAVTKYGTIYVGLSRSQITDNNSSIYRNTILEMIKILSREERMIQLLEDWLQVGLDLRPTQEVNGNYYTFKISDRNNASNNVTNKIVVMLECESIDKLPIPLWHENGRLYLTSSYVTVNLVLSSNTIDLAYLKLLKENSILMIPESFSKSWIGYARNEEISSGNIPITVDENLQIISINNEIHTSKSVDDTFQTVSNEYLNISFNGVVKLPFHFLLGWANTGSCIISKPLNYYTISINRGNACIATGQLVSISSGYGIHVNEVF